MNEGRFVFSQVVDFIPRIPFDSFVKQFKGDYRAHELTTYNQFLHLLFGQLTACVSLRDICLCLEAHKTSLWHLGFRNTVDSSSLSRANEKRNYRIYESLGYYLIDRVRPMYRHVKIENVTADNAIFALDSTTISVSLKLCEWALGKYSRGGIKMHTLLDLQGSIPTQVLITDSRWHDSNMLQELCIQPNAIYTADKAYVDLAQMFRINNKGAYFVMRPKGNMQFEVIRELDNNECGSTIRADYIVRLRTHKSKHLYPDELRIVKAIDPESGELISFITNNMELSATDIANIYRHRWDIELFFKWIKQNIVIKHLWGYSENAVKTHLWVAICTYLLVANIKAEYKSSYTITEVATLLCVSALERTYIKDLLTKPCDKQQSNPIFKDQLILF